MSKYVKYTHHGNEVFVREDLKGTHREHCLCFQCSKLNILDRNKNCPIANALYANCVKFKVTTPVFECPEFSEIKKETSDLGLAGKQAEVYELIKNSPIKVTVQVIEEKLSKGHVGALGHLLGRKLIESKKDRPEKNSILCPSKMIKYYIVSKKASE